MSPELTWVIVVFALMTSKKKAGIYVKTNITKYLVKYIQSPPLTSLWSTPPLSIQSTFHSIRAQSDRSTCVHMKFSTTEPSIWLFYIYMIKLFQFYTTSSNPFEISFSLSSVRSTEVFTQRLFSPIESSVWLHANVTTYGDRFVMFALTSSV